MRTWGNLVKSINHRNFITISDEVLHSIHKGLPVVALESTIISHGLPHPINVNTALAAEKTVRQKVIYT